MPVDIADGEVLGVLSDVHSNALAFGRALEMLRSEPVDRLVILGDLLTYGCAPRAVLELTAEAVASQGAALVLGNHDQFYIDLAAGQRRFLERMPDWIKETINHTSEQIDLRAFTTMLPWQERLFATDMLFAHANPYAYGDWTYLNSHEDHLEAAQTLERLGAAVAFFGHTHRQAVFHRPRTGPPTLAREDAEITLGSIGLGSLIINPGSVGQPRSGEALSTFARVSRRGETLRIQFEVIDYDVDGHIAQILASDLSEPTKQRLCSYFRPTV